MPEYLHPGVYIEETSFRGKPIEGVSTSTAGLVGRTRKGPEGTPTLVTSLAQFTREFGTPFSDLGNPSLGGYLGHAVRAFFENGGRRAYIVRTLPDDALASEAEMGTGTHLVLPANTTVREGATSFRLQSLRNLVDPGRTLPQTLRVFTRTGASYSHTLTLTVDNYDASTNEIEIPAPGIPPGVSLRADSTWFEIVGDAPSNTGGPEIVARHRGLAGDDIAVQARQADLPPARLTTARAQRHRPVIASGVATTTTQVTLGPLALRQLRNGDRISFGGDPLGTLRTVSGIPTVAVTRAVTAGAHANFPIGSTVHIVARDPGGGPVNPAADALIFELAAALNTTADPFPHNLAAILQVDDEIRIRGGGNDVTLQILTVPLAAAPVTFAPALAAGLAATTVRLEETLAATGNVQRLVVGDVTGLEIPFRQAPSLEPIAITDGVAPAPETGTISLVDATTNTVYVSALSGAIPAAWTSFESLQAAGATDVLRVASTGSFYTGAIVEIDTGANRFYATVTGVDPGTRTITLDSALADPIDVAAASGAREAYARTLEFDLLVYELGVLKETFPGLTWNPDPNTQSASRYFVTRVNDDATGSRLIRIVLPVPALPLDPTGQPTTPNGAPLRLSAGSDGSNVTPIHLIGRDNGPGRRTGIEALRERSDIALVAVPGVTDEAVQQALITHCELLRYRFAVLDGMRGESDVTRIQQHRNNYDSKYAGYYTPWLETLDLATGATIDVPPSGHVLGICARTDNERGVHKAPANEVVRGITDVTLPFTEGEQDVLNPVGVNLIRELEGRGIRVWGGRTISSDPEWKYVNVRRLFIFLEHSIDNGTQWVVFEPNSEALWERVKETIESFLFGVWSSGALMGTKPEEAFFVRCDRTTMTQDDIDNGRLVCLIGIAPVYPAEFVIFRIGQFTASTNRA